MVCDEFEFQCLREILFLKEELKKKDVTLGIEAFSCYSFELYVVDWCLLHGELVLCWHVCFFPIQAKQKKFLV